MSKGNGILESLSFLAVILGTVFGGILSTVFRGSEYWIGVVLVAYGFARVCGEAGLTFVGPSPEAIAAMGSKLEAKALMDKAGVPVLPGATVTDESDLGSLAADIGFPVLVKAALVKTSITAR